MWLRKYGIYVRVIVVICKKLGLRRLEFHIFYNDLIPEACCAWSSGGGT